MENPTQSKWLLVVIGAGKLLKAALLIFFALELHHLLDPNIAEKLRLWFHYVRVDPSNHHVHQLISRITGISPRKLHEIQLGSYIYAALFATEGTGLVLRKKWAEYMTLISTSLLLPMEVYEIFVGSHKLAKVILMAVNVAIVVYLAWQLNRSAAQGAAESPASG